MYETQGGTGIRSEMEQNGCLIHFTVRNVIPFTNTARLAVYTTPNIHMLQIQYTKGKQHSTIKSINVKHSVSCCEISTFKGMKLAQDSYTECLTTQCRNRSILDTLVSII